MSVLAYFAHPLRATPARRAASVLLAVAGLLAAPAAWGVTTVNLTKTLGNPGPVESGQTFNYNLAWSCPGSVTPADDCISMHIVESLPLALQATALPAPDGKLAKVCVQNPGDPLPDYATCPAGAAPTPAGATLHFIFINRVTAGDSGSLLVTTRFPVGSTPDGTSATNTATIAAQCDSVADPACVNPVPVATSSAPITATARDEVSLSKSILSNAAIGFDMVYRIQVCPGSGTGYLYPTNATLTDTLPAEATFVAANPAPASVAGQVLTWNLASPLTSCQNIDVTVNYGAGLNNPGDIRNNNVSLAYDPLPGSPALPRTAVRTHTLSAPAPGLNTSKTVNDAVVNAGQTMRYTLVADNSGNIPLGVRFVDAVPGLCRVSSFWMRADATACAVVLSDNSAGTCNAAGGGTRTAASTGADNVALFVKSIEVQYGDAGNPLVAVGGSRSVTIDCDVVNPGWDGSNPPLPAIVNNTATIDGANGVATSGPHTPSRNVTLRDAAANPTFQPDATKTKTAPAGTVAPGGNVTFSIAMTNSSAYSSAPEQVAMVQPVFADLLPAGMAFVSSSLSAAPAGCTSAGADTPAIHVIADYNGSGRQLVVWDWTGKTCSLARGDTVTFNLVASVGNTTLAGTRTNNVTFLGSNNPGATRATEVCATSGGDLAGILGGTLDGATGVADPAHLCHAGGGTFQVQRITNITSNKSVTGSLEAAGTWLLNTAEPNNVARTVHEGNVWWRLQINNTANIPLDNVEIVDIIPAAPADNPTGIGNSGVGTGASLGSTWSPRFVRAIDLSAAPGGTRVYYSQAANPCRNAIVAVPGCNPMTTLADGVPLSDETTAPLAGAPGEWSTVLPNDPERVRAFRIVYPPAYQIPPGQTLTFAFPMFVRADAPLTDCAGAASSACSNIAWNTFGFSYQEADSHLPNQSAPTRVGVVVQPLPPGTAGLGNFVWHDTNQNGLQDADELHNGINNVLVELWRDPDGVPNNGDEIRLVEALTANHPLSGLPGHYHFPVLAPTVGAERYFVRFHPPAGMTPSPANQGGNDAVDSDGVATLVGATTVDQTAGVSLAPGQDRLDVDQGYFAPAVFSLGNRVWYDDNNDGIDNDGPGLGAGSGTGIAGVGVELWAVDAGGNPTGGAPLASQATNASGHYLFTGLAAGDYRVVIPAGQFAAGQPLQGLYSSAVTRSGAGFTEGAPAAGNSDQDVRDHGGVLSAPLGAIPAGSVASGRVTLGPLNGEPVGETGTLGPRQTPGFYDTTPDNRGNLTLDFGFYALSVGNYLWFDDNNSGVWEAGEAPVAGVTVELLDSLGNLVGSAVSDGGGYWRVDGLAAGAYRARIAAAAFAPGQPLAGRRSSTGASTDFTLTGDRRDHGVDDANPAANGILSVAFALGSALPGGEPTGAGNGANGPRGDRADNLTVDFGFALAGAPVAPPPGTGSPVGVPTLSEWGVLLLALFMLLAGRRAIGGACAGGAARPV